MVKKTLSHRLFSGEWSKPLVREVFLRDPCVGVLLYDPEHQLVGLVQQFRVGALEHHISPWLYEVVAGIAEKGESHEQVARREVLEETGLQVETLLPICDYWVSPGGSTEHMYLFCAQLDLRSAGDIHGLESEGEDIALHVIPLEEVLSWLKNGNCNNAATVICLMWLREHCQGLL